MSGSEVKDHPEAPIWTAGVFKLSDIPVVSLVSFLALCGGKHTSGLRESSVTGLGMPISRIGRLCKVTARVKQNQRC